MKTAKNGQKIKFMKKTYVQLKVYQSQFYTTAGCNACYILHDLPDFFIDQGLYCTLFLVRVCSAWPIEECKGSSRRFMCLLKKSKCSCAQVEQKMNAYGFIKFNSLPSEVVSVPCKFFWTSIQQQESCHGKVVPCRQNNYQFMMN